MIFTEAVLLFILKNIRIAHVQQSDSGVYTCVARSRAGLAELSYDVQVQGTINSHHQLKRQEETLWIDRCH